MANKLLIEIEKQFRRERRRVTQLVRRLKKRGYIVPEKIIPVVPHEKKLSDIVALQTITPETIYQSLEFKDPISMELFTGEQGHQIEKHRRAVKTATTKGVRTKKGSNTISAGRQGKTSIEKQYTKERERIKSFIKRAEKRGYSFPDNFLPERPKHPTEEHLKQLKALTPEKIYEQGFYLVDTQTGEVVSGTAGRQMERLRASEKAKQTRNKAPKDNLKAETIEQETTAPVITDIVLNWVEDVFKNADTSDLTGKEKMQKEKHITQGEIILGDAILKYGRTEVARRLEENRESLESLINTIIGTRYDDYAVQLLTVFYEIVNDTTISLSEAKELESYFDESNSIMSLDELADIAAASSTFN